MSFFIFFILSADTPLRADVALWSRRDRDAGPRHVRVYECRGVVYA